MMTTKACLDHLSRFRVGRSPTSTLVARGSVGDGHVASHVADVADDAADGGKENLVKQTEDLFTTNYKIYILKDKC